MKSITTLVCGVTLAAVVPVAAQTPSPREQADARYRITQVERILEGAAEHGAKGAQERFKRIMPGDFLLTDDVHVRGFQLDAYGVFFDVQMPPLESTMPFIVRTLDQTGLTLENALRTWQAAIEAMNDAAAKQQNSQALERVAIQMGVTPPQSVVTQTSTTRTVSAQSTVGAQSLVPSSAPAVDPTANDPQAAYHAEVRDAVIDAMLDHGLSLRLKPEQRLTVAIRGADNLPRLGPGEPESPTIMISVSGADLTSLSLGQIVRDEARRRVRVED